MQQNTVENHLPLDFKQDQKHVLPYKDAALRVLQQIQTEWESFRQLFPGTVNVWDGYSPPWFNTEANTYGHFYISSSPEYISKGPRAFVISLLRDGERVLCEICILRVEYTRYHQTYPSVERVNMTSEFHADNPQDLAVELQQRILHAMSYAVVVDGALKVDSVLKRITPKTSRMKNWINWMRGNNQG